MSQKHIDKAAKVIAGKSGGGDEGYCVLSLIDNDGYPTASTIALSKADGIIEMTFCVYLDSNKVRRIGDCNRASVCFASAEHNISLVGTIEVLNDIESKKEAWYDSLTGMFTNVDNPVWCVLRFKTKRYNLFFTDDYQNVSGAL